MEEAFYRRDGDAFAPTELCRGPWSPDAQHAGPPSALLGRAVEAVGGGGMQTARVTVELLRPVPLRPVAVHAEIVRPGRSVELVEATATSEGHVVARARAWRIRTAGGQVPRVASDAQPPAPPEEAASRPFFPTGAEVGYHTAMDVRFTDGGFLDPGPATAWMRMRVPLVEGEEPSPLARVLVAADSGNGVSSPLDYGQFVFINTDLTVALHRLPEGDWVCLDARTVVERQGVGLTTSALWDRGGPLGLAVQTLYVAQRRPAVPGARRDARVP